jgi:hypothetical protein
MLGMPQMTTRQVAKELGLKHPQKVLRLEEQALEKVARGLRLLARYPEMVLNDDVPTAEEQPLVLAEIRRQLEAEKQFNLRNK